MAGADAVYGGPGDGVGLLVDGLDENAAAFRLSATSLHRNRIVGLQYFAALGALYEIQERPDLGRGVGLG